MTTLRENLARAATLEERIAWATRVTPEASPPTAERPFATMWREAIPLTPELDALRIAALGGAPVVEAALSLPTRELQDATIRWASRIEQVMHAYDGPASPLCWTEGGHPGELLMPLRPLIDDALERLRRELAELSDALPAPCFDAVAIARGIERDMLMSTFDLADRTLVAEVHRANDERGAHALDPRAEFLRWAYGRPGTTALSELLERYPVLGCLVVANLDDRHQLYGRVLRRFAADRDALATAGLLPAAAVLQKIEITGDLHGGDAVCICHATDGSRVAYKPRPGTLDSAFAGVLETLAQAGLPRPLRSVRLVLRGDYTWAEFVETRPCASASEVEAYYFAAGELLAILHALGSIDAHHENVIAAGTDPILIDAETLLRPGLRSPPLPGAPAPIQLVNHWLRGSICATGMLPGEEGLHCGGLATVVGAPSPIMIRRWEGLGTTEVRSVRESRAMPVRENVPRLNGTPRTAFGHVHHIEAGFQAAYMVLAACREALVAPGGPLDLGPDTSVRVVLRETRVYEMLRREATHPSLLRDGLDRDRFLDKLWRAVQHRPALAGAVLAERRAIVAGHVPRFDVAVTSRVLEGDGGVRLDGLVTDTTLDRLHQRLAGLDQRDATRQRWLLRATLAVAAHNAGSGRSLVPGWRPTFEGPMPLQVDRTWLLRQSEAIVRYLEDLAISDGPCTNWLGVVGTHDGAFAVRPLSLDLYEGLPGVALFLAEHAAQTGSPRATRLLEGAVASMRAFLDDPEWRPREVGAFVGWGGLAFTFARLYQHTSDPTYRALALAAGAAIEATDSDHPEPDIHSGDAGAVVALVAAAEALQAPELFAVARLCGDRLLEQLDVLLGLAAPVPGSPKAPGVCGVSHGAAGAAWALGRLHEVTGVRAYRDGAARALEHERASFDAEARNWPDLRVQLDTSVPRAPCSLWCNGAVGIGLTRVRLLGACPDAPMHDEIAHAIAATPVPNPELGHSLCHGDLGNLELLRAAADLDETRQPEFERASRAVLERIATEGLRGGCPVGVDVPGLMTGVAGIGYGLLRLASRSVPNLLLLETAR